MSILPSSRLEAGKVKYIHYSADAFGLISAGIDHFGENISAVLEEWKRNNQEFRY